MTQIKKQNKNISQKKKKPFKPLKPKMMYSPMRSTNKYGSIKTNKQLEDGTIVKTDSLLEARLFDKLYNDEYRNKHGIKSVEFQVSFDIVDGYTMYNYLSFEKNEGSRGYHDVLNDKKKIRGSVYIADFVITLNSGLELVVDAKGVETDVFKIKRKIFEQRYNKQLITINKTIIDGGYFDNYLLKLKNENEQ